MQREEMDRKPVNLVFEPYINSTVSLMTGGSLPIELATQKIKVYKGKF
jgi:hypothetical protein